MHYFTYKNKVLYCENVKVSELTARFGTPLYVYSKRTLCEHFLKIKRAFAPLQPLICYSVKANSNLSLLKILIHQGAGLDIVSGGELFRAKKVNCPPRKIVYASVGKRNEEIKEAIRYGILMFNVESAPELKRINEIANSMRKKVDVALRVNPDVGLSTHEYVVTAKKEAKFGVDIPTAQKVFLKRDSYKNCRIKGIHIHIGSQITEATPFVRAIKRIKIMVNILAKRGVRINYLNIGGGLGIIYDKEKPQTADEFARAVTPLLREMDVKLIVEPGRFIVGSAGILLTKVIYIKDTSQKRFIIVDAGMNDLIRPSLYNAFHTILPVRSLQKKPKGKVRKVDIVGPLCEAGDFLGKGRIMDVAQGEYLAVFGAGAYGFSMSSQYNSRPRAAEVLVDNKKVRLIRKRERYNDLISKEILI